MNEGVRFLLDLLYNRVKYMDKVVPVLKRSYPTDKTPCFTLDEQDTRLVRKYFTYEPEEFLNREFDTTIVLNAWCDDETARSILITQVKNLVDLLETDNYKLCSFYDYGICKNLDTSCPTPKNPKTAAGAKHQCLDPFTYGYENMFSKYNVYRNTLSVGEPVDNDELDRNPPILRSMISIGFKYRTKYCNDGKVSDTLEYNE